MDPEAIVISLKDMYIFVSNGHSGGNAMQSAWHLNKMRLCIIVGCNFLSHYYYNCDAEEDDGYHGLLREKKYILYFLWSVSRTVYFYVRLISIVDPKIKELISQLLLEQWSWFLLHPVIHSFMVDSRKSLFAL